MLIHHCCLSSHLMHLKTTALCFLKQKRAVVSVLYVCDYKAISHFKNLHPDCVLFFTTSQAHAAFKVPLQETLSKNSVSVSKCNNYIVVLLSKALH